MRGRPLSPVASEYLLDPVLCTQRFWSRGRGRAREREKNMCVLWGWVYRQEWRMPVEKWRADSAIPGKSPALDGDHPSCCPRLSPSAVTGSHFPGQPLSSSHTLILSFILYSCFLLSFLLRLPSHLRKITLVFISICRENVKDLS